MFYPGDLIGGRYRLGRCIARGGMGEIWDGTHVELEAPVAVKFMAPSLVASSIQRERFAREARATAQIQSPYVVRMSDFGVEGETPYIVMERLHGEDLSKRLSRLGVMAPHEVESLVTQTAKGLAFAHEAGIVHRDLKPSNIFLVPEEDGFLVKIVDFGVAKAPVQRRPGMDQEVTQTGMVLGSPQYMSPEQALGSRDVDHRADLWALSAIAMRSLTGKRLYEDMSSMEALGHLCRGKIPAIEEVAPELSPSLLEFFKKAMARDINTRFRSARQLSTAFKDAVEATRVPAQEVSSITGAAVAVGHTGASLTSPSMATGASMTAPSGQGRPVLVAMVVAITALAVMGVGAAAGLATEETPLTTRGRLVHNVHQRVAPALFKAFKLSIDAEAAQEAADAAAARSAEAKRQPPPAPVPAPIATASAAPAASVKLPAAPVPRRQRRWGF